MTLYEYLMFEKDGQWNELWDNGKFLTNYKSIDCSFALYALHKFFVEVELDPVLDTIIGMNIFKEGVKLEKYADQLDLDIYE